MTERFTATTAAGDALQIREATHSSVIQHECERPTLHDFDARTNAAERHPGLPANTRQQPSRASGDSAVPAYQAIPPPNELRVTAGEPATGPEQ